jgi:hypothetical protein
VSKGDELEVNLNLVPRLDGQRLRHQDRGDQPECRLHHRGLDRPTDAGLGVGRGSALPRPRAPRPQPALALHHRFGVHRFRIRRDQLGRHQLHHVCRRAAGGLPPARGPAPRPQMAKYNFRASTRYNLSGFTDQRILKNTTVGGSLRWIDKKAIGFLRRAVAARHDHRPRSQPAGLHPGRDPYRYVHVSYRTRLFADRVRANLQLNVRNLGENGGGLLPDGGHSPMAPRSLPHHRPAAVHPLTHRSRCSGWRRSVPIHPRAGLRIAGRPSKRGRQFRLGHV